MNRNLRNKPPSVPDTLEKIDKQREITEEIESLQRAANARGWMPSNYTKPGGKGRGEKKPNQPHILQGAHLVNQHDH